MTRLVFMLPILVGLLVAPTAHAQDGDDEADDDEANDDQADDDIVVIGSPHLHGDAGPASATRIEIDERWSAGSNVSDVMDAIPGAIERRLGGPGSWSGVSLRGSTFRQVQVHIDGVPLNPDGASAVDLSELPLRAFERVDVWRSQPPPWLAGAPIGGVVNMITPRGAAPARVTVGTGSFGSWSGSAFAGARLPTKREPVELLANATASGSHGDFVHFDDGGTPFTLVDDRLRRREHNQVQQGTAIFRARRGPPERRVSLLVTGLSKAQELAGPVGALPQGELNTQQFMASVDTKIARNGSELRGRFWALRRWEQHVDLSQTRSATSYVGAQAVARRIIAPWAVVGATSDLRVDMWDSGRDRAHRLSGTLAVDADMYLLDERLRLWPVVRVQVRTTQHAHDRRDRAAVSPRIGTSYRLREDVSVHAHVGSYERAPDFVELFAERGATSSNDQLVPERGVLIDLGLRARAETDQATIDFETTLFQRDTRDLIVYLPNSQRRSLPTNLERARVRGLELGADVRIADRVDSRTTATVQSASTWSPGGPHQAIPRLPSLRVGQRTSIHWDEHLRIGHAIRWSERTPLDGAGFQWTTRRASHDAFIRAQPRTMWPAIELEVRNVANNIASVEPLNPLSIVDPGRGVRPNTDFAGYPLPGRSAWLHLRWTGPPRSP